ncbi:polysaccharide biosynthesis protein [Erythrobacter sp. SDW2]|uniref:polysaccharide biosynthesis protein n=1 Tax=Erythrobacter sp. SDW2 TaxID=2907154 RepID=UPI001F2856D6|nr:nucleoside-diphosphate sugar epimerase/dehydratase [Erythrobacter sp. SDW2]UIP07364.1 polysaccharide biosynthesis protein [Erythrobacter sp. SDW2]
MQWLLDVLIGTLVRALERVAVFTRGQKRLTVLALDLVLLVQSVWMAYSLRMGEWAFWNDPILKFGGTALAVMLPAFIWSGVYNTIFRYAGVGMLRTLVRAFLIYTAVLAAVFTFYGIPTVPRTLGLLQPMLFFIFVAASRVIIRALIVDVLERRKFGGDVRRVLIYGAGRTGQQLASTMRSDPRFQLCGYIDDDKRLDGQRLDGLPVCWTGELEKLIERQEVTDILLALPGVTRKRRRQILKNLGEFNVLVQTLPTMSEIVDGKVSFSDIRPLDIEDLLGREPVQPNELLLGRTVVGKTVMVTGAGGSIGSELCRQIVMIGARKLVLFEVSEFALYAIHQELTKKLAAESRSLELVPVLDSIQAAERLDQVFAEHSVDTVYHAAAYKHVPLVEANPIAAMRNNIVGTRTLVEASARAGVADFILISTDKAVRPTNVMGASKRAAEQVVQAFAATSAKTRFSMVRFGNVLGSSGSVVPLFRRQIEAGGPITLTHKAVTRYFMTIPEAANLVIQAGGLASGGEVFVLDMGKPTRISDLARLMVRLSGLTVRDAQHPDGDIEIVEVGLRPGEKLYEELLIGEKPEETKHARIMKAHEDFMPWPRLDAALKQLAETDDPEQAIALLHRIVPEFEHNRDNKVA